MKKIFLMMLVLFLFPINCVATSIVLDMDNNRILEENNIHEKRLIASTTKIMTAILAIESNKLEQVVTVGDEVLTMYGSNIYIEKNENMLLLDLIYGLMLRSGNDAATTIAVYVGNTEENFIKMMNNKAKELGMKNTTFNNPHGLDDNTKNYSTAYDLAILYSYAYKNDIFKEIVATKTHVAESDLKLYEWTNKNKLLSQYQNTTGGKTGYTPDAGRILVSSANSNNMNICIVTFDSNSYLYEYHEEKYKDVFNRYKKYLILDKNNFSINNVNKNIYIKESYYLTLSEKEYNNIEVKTKINKKIKDNEYGKVLVYLNDELLYEESIFIKEEHKNLFEKIKEFIENKLVFN